MHEAKRLCSYGHSLFKYFFDFIQGFCYNIAMIEMKKLYKDLIENERKNTVWKNMK